MDKELDQVLADPRARLGPTSEAAREAAHARRAQLVDQARAVLDRGLAQLTAEAEVVEPALPPACAAGTSPSGTPVAHPPSRRSPCGSATSLSSESVPLRIPLLVRLPRERGLWVDSGPAAPADGVTRDSAELRHLALETAVALTARLLAVHPPGAFAVRVADPAGAGAQALLPLTRSGVLAAPPAAGAAGVTRVLEHLTRRVALVEMAMPAGAAGSLPAASTPRSNS
ncbi:hypothetical protein [Streptomyces sp. AGS-58]|uniref:hypothetical protein n=1 Tax=unclassified Streptomyces TaxID=2593676 RepID=UPI0035A39183